MTKELKLSFVLLAIFSGIILAFKTLTNFFVGAGINFVALCAIVILLLLIMLQNKNVKNRIIDMFIVACVFILLEFIVYLPVEFGITDYEVYRGFMIYQNVITFFGILFFAYIAFRFITEYRGVKIRFVEFLLGNRNKNATKEKKSKELENGSLEEKPNKVVEEKPENQTEEVLVETDEE